MPRTDATGDLNAGGQGLSPTCCLELCKRPVETLQEHLRKFATFYLPKISAMPAAGSGDRAFSTKLHVLPGWRRAWGGRSFLCSAGRY